MKLIDVAKEFAEVNIFNSYTESTIISRAKVFSSRTEVEEMNEITIQTIALFKKNTRNCEACYLQRVFTLLENRR